MGPLTGITVLDLTRILAGPFCTQMLSDLGATVWKVEAVGGDDTRTWGPPFVQGESTYFFSANRGKKSLAINLKEPRGQDLVRRLAARADVLVENYKAGNLAQFGLDAPTLLGEHPRLVYVSITGFGQTGPRAGEGAYDAAIQGLIGAMSLTGEPGGPPIKVGIAWTDILAGQTACIGVLAALRERDLSGVGQHVDLSLFETGLMSMVNQAQGYLISGQEPERLGNAHPSIVPYQTFEAQDGWLVLAVGNDAQYRRAVAAIGHPELWEEERFQTNVGRVTHRQDLVTRLTDIFRMRRRDEWLEVLSAAGVPATPIYTIAEAFQDPQASARHMVWEVVHPTAGRIPVVANALQHMSRTPLTPQSPPPLLGQHTREVLQQELGVITAELDQLERDGVIRATSAPDVRTPGL